jgi:DNA-binding NtrC family response regulator
MINILVVDDEPEMLESFKKILEHKRDYIVTTEEDKNRAIELVTNKKFDLVLTDLVLKNESGMDVLKAALNKYPDTPVIMISGYGTIENSVEAVKEGAFDFIEKPFNTKALFEVIERALKSTLKNIQSVGEIDEDKLDKLGIIYVGEKIGKLIETVKKIAPGNMNVLIYGESGTGKELFARAIHRLSKRNNEPFVPLNCAALPEHLFESELFGYEKGAFTGAVKTKPGLLEFANHGTFFFDEIGDMSLGLQVKLLRMLEEKKIRRIGGKEEINIDVRIIAATNKELESLVKEKLFREDLFYRLNTMSIIIPPLRERREDIIPIAGYFIADLCKKNDTPIKRFSSDAENALKHYDYPGNIRELQNIISRAFYLSNTNVIQKSELPIPGINNEKDIYEELYKMQFQAAKDHLIEKFEINYLKYNLALHNNNITKTAEACGIDRRTIHRLVKKYNL